MTSPENSLATLPSSPVLKARIKVVSSIRRKPNLTVKLRSSNTANTLKTRWMIFPRISNHL